MGILAMVLFGALVHYQIQNQNNSKLGYFGKVLLSIAEFPSHVRSALKDSPQIIHDNRFSHIDGFKSNNKVSDNVRKDTGYLLLSSYDYDEKQSSIKLIRIKDQKILHTWLPDIESLIEKNSISEVAKIAKSHFRLQNPLVMPNGNLVFNGSEYSLYNMNLCGEIDNFSDGHFHHSNELDHEGNIWTPSVIYPHSYPQLDKFRDDAIAKISPTGELLYRKSVAEILIENGYQGLLAIGLYEDPIHLNDIQPALSDSKFWKKGDLFLSLRHLSTVFLYRPSENKILWLSTGPWMHQHDVNFVDHETISIFGNDIINSRLLNGHNTIYFYNFNSKETSTPFDQVAKTMGLKTITQGIGTPISREEFFIEETNYGRIAKINTSQPLWEFVHRINEDSISMPAWSRYLKEVDVKKIINNIKNLSCIK